MEYVPPRKRERRVCQTSRPAILALIRAPRHPRAPRGMPAPQRQAGLARARHSSRGSRRVAVPVPVAPGAPALFIERFGVLLAVNAAAHMLWPALPYADATTQALA